MYTIVVGGLVHCYLYHHMGVSTSVSKGVFVANFTKKLRFTVGESKLRFTETGVVDTATNSGTRESEVIYAQFCNSVQPCCCILVAIG